MSNFDSMFLNIFHHNAYPTIFKHRRFITFVQSIMIKCGNFETEIKIKEIIIDDPYYRIGK